MSSINPIEFWLKSFSHEGKALLRSPLHSHELLSVPVTPEILKSFFSQDINREALFIASSALHDEFKRWLQDEQYPKKKLNKLLASLHKYYSRMCSRSTPFGLFAGCSVVEFGENNNVQFAEQEKLSRAIRLDMACVCKILDYVERLPEIRVHLKYFPNSSIYSVDDQIRYVEYNLHSGFRSYRVVATPNSEYLDLIIGRSRYGATMNELAETLLPLDISTEEAHDFIVQLVDTQILVSELEPNVTGGDCFTRLINNLVEINEPLVSTLVTDLIEIKNKVESLSQCARGLKPDDYAEIIDLIRLLPVKIDVKNYFQVDLYKPVKTAVLNKQVATDTLEALYVLSRINSQVGNPILEAFIDGFYERFEEREIPLVVALDPQIGIGYPAFEQNENTPLLLGLPNATANRGGSNVITNDSYLLKKYCEALQHHKTEIEIHENEINNVSGLPGQIPEVLTAMVTILEQSDTGTLLEMISASHTSATHLLGRFGHLNPEVEQLSRDIAKNEQDVHRDCILAEVVHLPESRLGNILSRPQLRQFEIPFLAKSSASDDAIIPIADILVSVKNRKVTLRSKSLNKQVLPRLSSAHNFRSSSLPIYRFLCEVQYQQQGVYRFSWPAIFSGFSKLPRVRYKNVVLSRATWIFQRKQFEDILEGSFTSQKFNKWKTDNGLPDQFILVAGDNELYVNSADELSVRCFLKEIRKPSTIVLTEVLHEKLPNGITDEDGSAYKNQLVLSYYSSSPIQHQQFNGIQNTTEIVQRQFAPGDDWVYIKFYCGGKTSDDLMISLSDKLSVMNNDRIIDKWFFIRYRDPREHLRLRMKCGSNAPNVLKEVMEITKPFLDKGTVAKVQLDTYKRELERYGLVKMEIAEALFHYDSVFALEAIKLTLSSSNENLRWLAAVAGIDQLLTVFGFNLSQKYELMHILANRFGAEFNVDKAIKQMIADKYRKYKSVLNKIIDFEHDPEINELRTIQGLLKTRSNSVRPYASEAIISNEERPSVNEFICSVIHMNINRMFRTRQRQHEMVIYDLLAQHYKSQIARLKKASTLVR